jgi:hypothetical protein
MGLHANIHQLGREVSIALEGQFRSAEAGQLQAILVHFHSRGCRTFMLDLSRVAPLDAHARKSLSALIGESPISARSISSGSAIRLLADTPAAHPQTGCGGLALTAA